MKRDFDVYASLLSATPEDADNVASWLADREAASKIEKMKVDETVQDAARLASEANAYDENIAISQIRILSKRYTSDPDVIPYVAVIDKWDDEMWLIIPFSPYKTPATPGEMATGLDTFGLHVLQAWNGRTVQDEIFKKSYLFGALPEGVRDDALALFRHEMGGVVLPPDFKSQRGSPIVEATDPRREYLAECIARLQPLSDAVLNGSDASERGLRERINKIFRLDDYGIAAGNLRYNVVHDFQIECFGGFVRMEWSPQEQCVYARVYDNQGELSKSLDGFKLVTGDGKEIGSIVNCGACVHIGKGFDGKLALLDNKNKLLNLQKVEEP